ncbi:hypothetical protein KP77_28100 [Jeotgalibacillus alimentarius]|uniref:Bacterial microcompartment domain-containing protein n=1 Tax=Jeotgalibacillus alimentarius TaxID=135826 RepID=A0A0C2VRR0_9BACL|nr:BMC domain-containing protein [Jeotgalibacillus alimentarius]KIL46683.1 hypothetical protein KP77_28100 [Jeotgalibacillus alimentarius]
MDKPEAIGLIETTFYTTALRLVDMVCKAADIRLISSEKYLGGRLVTLVIAGSVSSVKEALFFAEQGDSQNHIKSAILISSPADEIMKYLATKKTKKNMEETENE